MSALHNYHYDNSSPGLINSSGDDSSSVSSSEAYNIDEILIDVPAFSQAPNMNALSRVSITHKAKKRLESLKPLNLTSFEITCIEDYTAEGYKYLNKFLVTQRKPESDFRHLECIDSIEHKFPMVEGETNYEERLVYYYFVNLYNTILRKGIKTNSPFILFRSTKTWNLKKNTDRFYYFSSFVSTSYDENMARDFVDEDGTRSNKLYMFYVHPQSNYINVSDISYYEGEKEMLLTPYHRYIYIGRENRRGYETRKYIIFPCDINIPSSYDSFMPWKRTINSLTSPLNGGKTNDSQIISHIHESIETPVLSKNAPGSLLVKTEESRFIHALQSFPGKEPNKSELMYIKWFSTHLGGRRKTLKVSRVRTIQKTRRAR